MKSILVVVVAFRCEHPSVSIPFDFHVLWDTVRSMLEPEPDTTPLPERGAP